MSSDAATPATSAADGQVPQPRSGAVPDVATDEPTGPTTEAADGTTTESADGTTAESADGTTAESADEPPGSARSDGAAVSDGAADADESDEARGGRLTARVREARARLEPDAPVIPAPRSPEGVVPPPEVGRGEGAPSSDLLRSVDDLRRSLARLEDAPEAPARRALVRVIELSAAGVPEAGWSTAERFDADALVGAAELAGTLHTSATALLERLDAEDRAAPAVEIGAVVTALQVARMVLDLESFARRGR